MKKYTLYNNFHHTKATFVAPENPDGAYAAYLEISYLKDAGDSWAQRKLRSIHHKLCPHSWGCACRGMIGG